ncbi:5'-methylthioadenosine/S-adenosylhomocysteine nucleosidase [Helicobacter sp. 13S00401-1]|uniref:5'-methylthioadenosine/adenosylhomocysteine nucleosidase n=1 Tax=Helicobacter sp. 13S00401-1 TaxID=1905758 RepID=UPI000BA65F3E|nr:5'-methylthioadenosine/adenosylhomocysteine nucleosidase [Helicobacter sp. 13S00401-1]PAF51396.1 5'-methylthioadenosine/S-adenosylhomocysteine nucleosidase [Helicobacter sp. 13S00401-1]
MTIGILGAMQEEIEPLLNYFKDYKTIEVGKQNFYQVNYKNHTLYIAYSRIGKVHAALSASVLTLKFDCEKVIFSGVAGGLASDLKVGDLLLGSKTCQYDVDISAFGHPLGFIPESKVYMESDASLNALARKVAKSMNIDLKEGIIASGDSFVASAEKKEWIKDTFKASVVEMEGASVAVVCDSLNVPFCILRSISDSADGSADVSFDEFLESSAKVSANFVIKMLDMMEG